MTKVKDDYWFLTVSEKTIENFITGIIIHLNKCSIAAMETQRLIIDSLTMNDSGFIFELVNSLGWIKFIGDRNVHSIADAEKYIQRILNNPKFTYYVFRLKENNTAIGIVTFLQRDDLEHPDIGFAMLPAFEGKGYAFEASRKVLDEIIQSKKYSKILAITLKHNRQSIQLLEKLGLKQEREKNNEGEELFVYALTLT